MLASRVSPVKTVMKREGLVFADLRTGPGGHGCDAG